MLLRGSSHARLSQNSSALRVAQAKPASLAGNDQRIALGPQGPPACRNSRWPRQPAEWTRRSVRWATDSALAHHPGLCTMSEERDGALSILASSSKPEGASVSSSGLDMSVRSKSGSTCGNVRDEALIRSPARSLHRGGRGGRSLGEALAARVSAAGLPGVR